MQLVYKVEHVSAPIHLRSPAEVAQKKHEVVIAAYSDVSNIIVLASYGEPLSLRHTQQKPGEPAPEAAAQYQQALAVQLVEEQRRAVRFRLQRMEEFHEVFLGHSVCGRRR